MIQSKLISIKHINREVHDFKANAGYILIILEIGKAFVSRGERCFLLDQMECVLLDGAENISILPDTRTGGFSASVVCFKTEEDLSRACDICTKNSYFILHRLAERLFELTGRNDLSEGWEKQLAMGKLLFLLKTIHKEDDSIKQSLRYIHDNYPLSINRETLAADAHMSVSRFSHRFRETYGASPIDYLKDTRLKHAKVLLKKEHTSMQETADAVGFNDVFYFSRQFRKSFGISPSAYAATVPLKVVSLNYQLTGDLQAADIYPETGILDVYRSWYTDRSLRRKENLFIRGNQRLTPDIIHFNMQRLSQIRPDVIFCTPYEMNFYDLDELRRIAPTEVIPWMEMDWKGHLRTLADCLGAGRKAEKWISRFEFRADSTEKNIRQLIAYTSVSVLHFIRGELVVYGDRNGGSVFFHELGIRSSYPLEDITVYQKLNEDEIQKYAGDITVICVDNDSRSKKRLNQLLASPEWKDFNDHHDTRMYICKDDPWVDYCALSHASILNRINMMFG